MKTLSNVLLGTLTILCSVRAQEPFGAMQGSVTAEDGSPIAGAVVFYSRIARLVGPAAQARLAPGETIVRSNVLSDSNGVFTLSNLPAGDYLLCPEVASAPYLNPCKWFATPKVTLSAGAVERPTLVLKKGVSLRVRVNDPAGLLPPVRDDPSRAANLIIGVVFGSGAFLAAANTSTDQAGRDYKISVPAGVPCSAGGCMRRFRESPCKQTGFGAAFKIPGLYPRG